MLVLADKPNAGTVWTSWHANESICITAKEQRLPNYQHANAVLEQSGIELAVRRSGGTTVPHGAGILGITNISTSNGAKDIRQSYLRFCTTIQDQLSEFGFDTNVGSSHGAYCDGDYNVLLDNKKLAGTAQRWKRGKNNSSIILNHAVMLVTCDAAQATGRVNQFHKLAEQQEPFNPNATTSLWESPQNKHQSTYSKDIFFTQIAESFRSPDQNQQANANDLVTP